MESRESRVLKLVGAVTRALQARATASSQSLLHEMTGHSEPPDYHRVQRIRSKKATSWIEGPRTADNLIITSVALQPIEAVMRMTQFVQGPYGF